MIIEFQDRLKRTVIVDTAAIVCLIEDLEFTTSGNDVRKSGLWDVIILKSVAIQVDQKTKEFIVDKWENPV
jgi:hypothetical protein